MLQWAREDVGYTQEQAAAAIGVSLETLKRAEAGEHRLTLRQLQTAAKRYNCPIGYFYLKNRPYEKTYEPVPDFRVEPDFVGTDHYRLNLEIKKVRDRRAVFLELAETLDIEIPRFEQINTSNVRNAAKQIRERLGIRSKQISRLPISQVYPYWKSKVEQDGVLVYESQYIPDETGVIGVAIYYDVCPIILIKRGPRVNERKLFTLLHEYAHLLSGLSAINDTQSLTIRNESGDTTSIESRCNRLAAEILIPTDEVNLQRDDDVEPFELMERLSATFKVTYSTAAVALRQLGLIDQRELSDLLEMRQRETASRQALQQRKARIPRENLMRLDMGRPMFNLIRDAYSSGAIDVLDAAKILNLRVNKVEKLVSGDI
jgi:Zn-dependent peptidase ImmA (M78 family)/DNA-binding XRE family transcriptional regulator